MMWAGIVRNIRGAEHLFFQLAPGFFLSTTASVLFNKASKPRIKSILNGLQRTKKDVFISFTKEYNDLA